MTWYRLLALGWTLAIVVACSIPGQELPDAPVLGFDKLVHFASFAGYGWLWFAALRQRSRRTWIVLISGIAFAILTEVYQHLMPIGRTGDPYDAVADIAGLLVGILVIRWRHQAHQEERLQA
jgi:VanZ family protein